MPFIELSLFHHPSRVAFAPEKVIDRVKRRFPEAVILPGDRTEAEVELAQQLFAEELRHNPSGPANRVVSSLRRKALSYGPSYPFIVPRSEEEPISGAAQSASVTFLSQTPFGEELRREIIDFLRSLGIGYLRASTGDKPQAELLAELNGPSDCLRDDGRVPWMEATPSEPFTSEAG